VCVLALPVSLPGTLCAVAAARRSGAGVCLGGLRYVGAVLDVGSAFLPGTAA
jgi:hypothetical protein